MVVFSIDSYALALFSVSSCDIIKIQTSCDELDLIRSKLCIMLSLSYFIKPIGPHFVKGLYRNKLKVRKLHPVNNRQNKYNHH